MVASSPELQQWGWHIERMGGVPHTSCATHYAWDGAPSARHSFLSCAHTHTRTHAPPPQTVKEEEKLPVHDANTKFRKGGFWLDP